MKPIRLAACGLALALAASALAQTKPAAPQPGRDLAQLMMSEKVFQQLLDRYAADMAGQIKFGLSHGGAQVPKDVDAKVRAELGKAVTYAEVTDLQANVLAKHYSTDELQQLVAFYRSPVGQKVLAEFPAVADEVNRGVVERVDKKRSAIFDQFAPKGMKGPAKPAAKPSSETKTTAPVTPPPAKSTASTKKADP